MQRESIEVLQKKTVIESQRRGDVSQASKSDQANAIIGAAVDEFFQHVFSNDQSIDPLAIQFKILRFHAAGQIERDDDVDSAGVNGSVALGPLRARQADDEASQRQPAQHRKNLSRAGRRDVANLLEDRKSTRLNSSHLGISYAVFCLKKKKTKKIRTKYEYRD